MKCPECSNNQKVKDGMKCSQCGYSFTFNPKEYATSGMTDGKFMACLRAASQNNTKWFTENQLYAALCRRRAKSIFPSFIADLFKPKTRPDYLTELLRRWESGGKKMENWIPKPSLHEPPPEWSEPDIYDYGVERILVVERDILVDWFVKNGVHAEQRMLVLAESGYPQYLLPVARRLLEEQPNLPVFLLHDATAQGSGMKDRLLAGGLLPLEGRQVTDLGMFPTDFRQLKQTRYFDPDDTQRALPVDAMMLPFFAMGLEMAMAEQMTFETMMAEQQRGGVHDLHSNFG